MSTVWTGYGRPVYGELRAAVSRLKQSDPLTPVTVLVPADLVGVHVRRALARGVGPHDGVAALDVLTVDRLAERIAAPAMAGSGRRPVTEPVLAAAWRRALAGDPGVFAPVRDHPATVRALTRAHRELREVDGTGQEAIAAYGVVQSDLIRLHRRVVALLAGDWYDVPDLRRTAASSPARGAVIDFLPAAERPASAIDLVTALPDVVSIQAVERETAPAEVFNASDSDDEARAVVRRVTAALRDTPAHRVAILHGAAEPYARLLGEHLDAAAIRWHGAGVVPTIERRLARVLMNLFSAAAGDWRRAEVIGVLADTDVGSTARWERISRAAGVVGGEDWEERLKAYAAAQRADRRRDAEAADELRQRVTGLQDRMRDGEALGTWPELAEWGRLTYAALVGDLEDRRAPDEEERAGATVLRTLDALTGLTTVEPAADLDLLVSTMDLQLSGDRPRHGRTGHGVLVAPLSAAIGLDVDVVYVLGLAEDLVPGRIGADALLPEEVRGLTCGQLPGPRERIERRRREVHAAFAAAPVVTASYPRGDLRRSTERRPSRWLPGVPAEVVPSYATALLTGADLASEQEWRIRAAAAGTLVDDPIVRLAAELRAARRSDRLTRFDGNLAGQTLPDPTDGSVISATSLEAWARCPHAYFVQKLLRVRPIETPEERVTITPSELGNLYHHVLDRFFREQDERGAMPAGTTQWTVAQRDDLRRIAIEEAEDLAVRGRTGHRLLWRRELAHVLKRLDGFLTDDDAVRGPTGRHQVRAELSFGLDGQPPVPVPLSDGRVLLMKGSADRVDRCGDAIVVVDYKSGGTRGFTGLGPDDPTLGGAKLQLPVYGLAARLALGVPGADVAAEYWFLDKEAGRRVTLDLGADVTAAFTGAVTVIASGIANGLFPHRPPEEDGWGGYLPCAYCDPDALGADELRERWELKRADPLLASYLAMIGGAS